MRCFLLLSVAALAVGAGCTDGGSGSDDDESAGQASGATSGSGGSGGSTGGTAGGGSSGTTYTPTPGGYHVSGNRILDANGADHVFRGVSRPSFEWSPDGEQVTSTDWVRIKGWGANVVRLPMNQYFWREKSTYRQRIAIAVRQIKETGMDVILDLHWSEGATPGTDAVPGAQQEMADAGSVTFWQEVANEYKTDSRVLFELYNEPKLVSQGTDQGWNIWLNGGSVGGFTAVGMSQLYKAVRDTGATNIVILGGIDWAYDLSGVPSHLIPGATNVAYAVHPYYHTGKMMSDWEADWGAVLPNHPIIITEFGRHDGNCDSAYSQQVISYANGRQLGWVGWAWFPKDCSFPSLISDYAGTPTAMGTVVKNALTSLAGL